MKRMHRAVLLTSSVVGGVGAAPVALDRPRPRHRGALAARRRTASRTGCSSRCSRPATPTSPRCACASASCRTASTRSPRPNCTTGTVGQLHGDRGQHAGQLHGPGRRDRLLLGDRRTRRRRSSSHGARSPRPTRTTASSGSRSSDGNLTVYYYFGDVASQQSVLNTARETIDRFSKLEKHDGRLPGEDLGLPDGGRDGAGGRQPAGSGPDTSISTLGEVGARPTRRSSRATPTS